MREMSAIRRISVAVRLNRYSGKSAVWVTRSARRVSTGWPLARIDIRILPKGAVDGSEPALLARVAAIPELPKQARRGRAGIDGEPTADERRDLGVGARRTCVAGERWSGRE